MIFVTVGTARDPFTRLLRAMDELAGRGEFGDEPVVLQSGHADYAAQHCEQRPFLEREEFERRIEEAAVVVCHGGGTCILQVCRTGKVPVAMPRLRRYDEAVDDHQVELVRELAAAGKAVEASGPEDLPAAIRQARRLGRGAEAPPPPRLVGMVCEAIAELIGPPETAT